MIGETVATWKDCFLIVGSYSFAPSALASFRMGMLAEPACGALLPCLA
jgi:hypothetical protein